MEAPRSRTEKNLAFFLLFVHTTVSFAALLMAATHGVEWRAFHWLEGLLTGAIILKKDPVAFGASGEFLPGLSLFVSLILSGVLFTTQNERIREFMREADLKD